MFFHDHFVAPATTTSDQGKPRRQAAGTGPLTWTNADTVQTGTLPYSCNTLTRANDIPPGVLVRLAASGCGYSMSGRKGVPEDTDRARGGRETGQKGETPQK